MSEKVVSKSNHELVVDLKRLVQTERRILSDVVAHLEEVNRRKLFIDMGYKSLLKYCVGELKYSESAAYRRIKTIKLAKIVPDLVNEIKKGAINLSQSAMAQGLFDGRKVEKEKQKSIISEIRNKSAKKSEDIIRERLELPPRKVFLNIEISDGTKKVWNELKARSAHMDLTDEALLLRMMERSIGDFIPKLKNYSISKKQKSNKQRYISENLKAHVFKRAKNKCERCCSVYSLEVEHIKPVALGGLSEIDNLMLLCKACNLRSAIKSMGMDKMGEFI